MSDLDSTVDPAAESRERASGKRGCLGNLGCVLCLLIMLLLLAGVALGPIGPGNQRWPESAATLQARSIGLGMFQYSTDNDGAYPEGNSSTEVFQKLIDGKYCSDPGVFYIPRVGKTKALPGEKLKPENVCFDVTCCLDASSGDELPVVFTTGYKVNYVPGGTAIPLQNSPQFNDDSRSWLQWWSDDQAPWGDAGIAVMYKGNNAEFLKLSPIVNADGSIPYPLSYKPDALIPNFISREFKAKGKTYRQLTPDGPLP